MEMTEEKSTINKLILLFVLDKMEIPLTENSIVEICTSGKNPWINYMEYRDIKQELIEVGFIYKTSETGGEERYNLTYEGRNCLSHFYSRIPLKLREEITTFTKENRLHFKRSQEYVGDYSKNDDGSYTVTLRIRAPFINQPMLELKTKAPSRQSAIEAVKKWKDKAHLVYEYIYETLINID
ncbi:MAG: DUF4364 family protein [Christensenellales bacterium]|jgi:predicted transcriptional regulator